MLSLPLNFKEWIEAHRGRFKPPVGNVQVWKDRDFMVTVVGGPNARSDFHINEGEEFFYQLEGDMVLRVIEDGVVKDMPIREGEIFLLPPKVPHSPQRKGGTLGLVIERRRAEHEQDGVMWICSKCGNRLYDEYFHLTDITTQLQPVFARFFDNPANCTCKTCGHVEGRPTLPPQATT
jgi:3-hydroxyanthranilate 3,4-dioxygenase